MDTLTEHQKDMLPLLFELGLILYTKKKRCGIVNFPTVAFRMRSLRCNERRLLPDR